MPRFSEAVWAVRNRYGEIVGSLLARIERDPFAAKTFVAAGFAICALIAFYVWFYLRIS